MDLTPLLRRLLPLLFVILVALPACSPTPPAPEPSPTAPSQPAEMATATPAPSPTPEPSVVLLVGGADGQADGIKASLETLAASAGLQVQEKDSLSSSDLSPATRVVIAFPPDPGLESLAASAPGTQFVGIGIQGVNPGPNLTVIAAGGEDEARQAFLGGYLAALAAPDWRAGVLSLTGETAGQAALNGGRYLCGLCTPKYPPYANYPVLVEMDTPAGWQTAVEAFTKQGIKTIYVTPAASTPETLAGLANAGLRLVSAPPSGEVDPAAWVATVRVVDPAQALTTLWPDLLAGKGGAQVPSGLEIAQPNPDWLPPGRLQLAGQVAKDLAGGFILPTNP